MQRKIGDFHNEFYIKQIEKLAYHRSYNKILRKHHVDDIIHKAFESTPGDISTPSDYSERFGFDTDSQIQNEFYDNNCSLSTEGCCLDCFIKQVNVSSFMTMVVGMFTNIMKRYGSFTYIYLIQRCKMPLQLQIISIHYWQKFLIKKMIRGRTIWDQTDGCAN